MLSGRRSEPEIASVHLSKRMTPAMTIPPSRSLETPRLLLRVCQPGDTDAVFAAETESSEQLRQWFWWMHPEHTREHCAAWAASRVDAWLQGKEFSFLVITKSDQRIVGCTWLN